MPNTAMAQDDPNSSRIVRHGPLSLRLPAGWDDQSQIIILGPEVEGFRCNLVFSREPTLPGESSEEFAERQIPSLQQALRDYTIINEGPATYGTFSGFLREHSFVMDNGAEIGQLQFYVIRDDVAYTFTFTQLKERLSLDRVLAESLFSEATLDSTAF